MGKRQHNNDEEKKNKKTKVDEEVEETPEVNEVKSKKDKKNKKQNEENVVSSPIKDKKDKKDKKNKKEEVMEEVEESTEKKSKKDKKNKNKKEKTEEVEENPVEKDEDEFQIVSPSSTTANSKGKLSISAQNVPVDNDFVEVYVNGFPFECTEDSVRELFGKHGTIDSVTVPTFPDNPNKAKGFGFVKYTSNEEAKKSLALNGYQWGKRTLKVEPRLSKDTGGRGGGDNKFNKNNTRFGNKGGNNNSGGGGNKFNSGPLSGNPDKDCDTLFCGNLSYEIQDADFYEFFKSCGEIVQIRYGEDKETGKFKGFAFVQFDNRNSVIKGGELNGQELKGRTIKIDYAAPKRR